MHPTAVVTRGSGENSYDRCALNGGDRSVRRHLSTIREGATAPSGAMTGRQEEGRRAAAHNPAVARDGRGGVARAGAGLVLAPAAGGEGDV